MAQPIQPPSSRLGWIPAVIIAVAIVALGIIYFAHKRANAPSPAAAAVPQLKVDKITLAPSEVPKQFPPELLPLEHGATLTQNFNASTDDGRFQATRAYETSQALTDVIAAYRATLTKNGWKIQSTLNQPTLQVIIADKGSVEVLVTASENSHTHVHTVTVSATTTNASS